MNTCWVNGGPLRFILYGSSIAKPCDFFAKFRLYTDCHPNLSFDSSTTDLTDIYKYLISFLQFLFI